MTTDIPIVECMGDPMITCRGGSPIQALLALMDAIGIKWELGVSTPRFMDTHVLLLRKHNQASARRRMHGAVLFSRTSKGEAHAIAAVHSDALIDSRHGSTISVKWGRAGACLAAAAAIDNPVITDVIGMYVLGLPTAKVCWAAAQCTRHMTHLPFLPTVWAWSDLPRTCEGELHGTLMIVDDTAECVWVYFWKGTTVAMLPMVMKALGATSTGYALA